MEDDVIHIAMGLYVWVCRFANPTSVSIAEPKLTAMARMDLAAGSTKDIILVMPPSIASSSGHLELPTSPAS